MIYLVTKKISLFEGNYQTCSLEFCLDYFEHHKTVSVDTETTGFDAHTDNILTIQIGDGNLQFVIDNDINYLLLKDFLESKELILHNAKFDLRFLYKLGIFPNQVWDTYLAECVIYRGLESRKRLDFVVEKYSGATDVDKSERGNIHKFGLIDSVIRYCAKDVEYLGVVKAEQYKLLEKADLLDYMTLENSFVLSLAYIEFCGFKLNIEAWRKKIVKNKTDLFESLQNLDNYIIENKIEKFINRQGNLFSESLHTNINWSSSRQVIKLFKHLGIEVQVEEDGQIKESVQAKNIKLKKHDIIPLYIDYKKKEKIITTYGENIIKAVNSKTGRIHTQYKQILNTGRISSGGKDKKTGLEYINLQNLPRDKETREAFVADEGNVLVLADYSSQESVVLANQSKEKNLIAFFKSDFKDIHSFVASKMYDLPIEDIKEKYSEQRSLAKNAGFAINYGGTGFTISQNSGISKEKGEEVYNKYFEAFPDLKGYFEQLKKIGLTRDYVLINDIFRAKTYYTPIYEEYQSYHKEFTKEFWDLYRDKKANNASDFPLYKEKVSRYFRLKGEIERLNLNFPIQGSSGEITKLASILVFKWIKENNLLNTVKFCNTIHDELILECPEYMGKDIEEMLLKKMIEGGKIYSPIIPLKAETKVSKKWEK